MGTGKKYAASGSNTRTTSSSQKDAAKQMREDAVDTQRVLIEAETRSFYSKEDLDKLYEKYGPYASDLVRIAISNPSKFDDNSSLYGYSNLTTEECLKNILEQDLSDEKISRIVDKPRGEVRSNIDEYKKRKEEERQIDQTYQEICGGKAKDKVSIDDLLAAGVTEQDIQALYEKDHSLLGAIGGGTTCQRLTASANKKKSTSQGNCKTGVDEIHRRAGLETDSLHTVQAQRAIQLDKIQHPAQGNSGGGCNVDEGLLASGDYVEIKVKNTAYLKTKGGKEDREMNELFNTCQPGITMTVDSVPDRTTKQAQTQGGIYGHTAVKRSVGEPWACDFRQKSINFARYGEYAHACFPKDAEVPAEYAKLLIKQAQERTGQCLNVKENQENYARNKRKQTKESMKRDADNAKGRVAAANARNRKGKGKRKSTQNRNKKRSSSKSRTTTATKNRGRGGRS